MRRFIVDTDTASDDAAALMIAALSEEIDLLGVTIVAGNVGLKQATDNALMTLEVCGSDAPVYLGAKRPLFRERHETISVHGKDGMGDCGIIHPKRSPEEKRAVEFILEQVERYPNEVELVVLGPATNIALAILTDREIMSKVKHIWSMGTPGFGFGNATPVSEFNVFIDAEAYALMLDLEIPVTIAGFDLCAGNIGLDRYELSYLAHGSKPAQFLEQATSKLLQFNLDTRGVHMVDLPDAIAMAAAVWPEFVQDKVACHCHCCTEPGHAYGQVIFYQKGRTYEAMPEISRFNAQVIKKVDEKLAHGSKPAQFLEQATSKLLQFNLDTRGVHMVDLPDAIAMAAAVWPEFVQDKVACHCHCCTEPGHAYGQVIFYQKGRTYEAMPEISRFNAQVIKKVDEKLFTERFMDLLMEEGGKEA